MKKNKKKVKRFQQTLSLFTPPSPPPIIKHVPNPKVEKTGSLHLSHSAFPPRQHVQPQAPLHRQPPLDRRGLDA